MWRTVIFFVIAFWLVMTILLVRLTYYPEGFQIAEIPPKAVLRMFLEQGATESRDTSSLFLYRKEKKLGEVRISTRRIQHPPGTTEHAIMLTGLLEPGSLENVKGFVMWNLELRVRDFETWTGARGRVRIAREGLNLDFDWKQGEKLPKFELVKNGSLVADNNIAQLMMAQGALSDQGSPLASLGLSGKESMDEIFQLRGLQGILNIAGQSRRTQVLELRALDRWKVKAYFTDAGELAMVDMPEGYRLLHQIIFGLVPDYTEEEMEELQGQEGKS